MYKLKLIVLCVIYLAMVIIAIPLIIVGFIAALITYGICMIERLIISNIDDNGVTRVWNEVAQAAYEGFRSAGIAFRDKMEL